MNFIVAIRLLVGVSLYITIWSYFPGKVLIVQLMSIGLFTLAGILSWLSLDKKRKLSGLEITFLFMASLSIWTSLMTGNAYSFQYSIVFAVFCLNVLFIARALDVQQLVDVYCKTLFFIIVTILLYERESLLFTLSVVSGEHGLFRFTPLGMHPNLVGVVYSGSAIILAFKGVYEKEGFKKVIFFSGVGICILFVLAASARSSLLALFLAFAIWVFKYIRTMDNVRLSYLVIALLCLSGLLIVEFDKIYSYISDILQFNSETRGLGSGGSGRVELWYKGVLMIIDDPLRLFFGYGFRSAEQDIIGISLENAYLTLTYEVGLIATLILVLSLVYISFKSLKLSDLNEERGIGIYYLIGISIIYLMMQSFFNRYLISIGNFYSMFFFILIFKVSIIDQYKLKFKL